MATKLTLIINDRVLKKANKFARERGQSLSLIIEEYLSTLTIKNEQAIPTETFTPKTKSLKGSFNAPRSFKYKKTLGEILLKKYITKQ